MSIKEDNSTATQVTARCWKSPTNPITMGIENFSYASRDQGNQGTMMRMRRRGGVGPVGDAMLLMDVSICLKGADCDCILQEEEGEEETEDVAFVEIQVLASLIKSTSS